jgi:Uma2 family endonuclease
MSAVTVLRVPPDGWTVDDLPDREDFRYELVDGALLVTPPPSVRHAFAVSRLHAALLAAVPVGVEVIGPGVCFDRRNYREPDLGLVRSTAIAQERIGPGDLLLAVEVMSPSSVATDRVAKPAQYAAAGIPHFWRLELDGPVLVRYALDGEVYREVGRDTGVAQVEQPVQVSIDVAGLLA